MQTETQGRDPMNKKDVATAVRAFCDNRGITTTATRKFISRLLDEGVLSPKDLEGVLCVERAVLLRLPGKFIVITEQGDVV